MGDGMIAYFGYPVAQEDAVERSVRAGLAMLDGVGELNAGGTLRLGTDLAIRVGIHAGPVVLDQVAGTTQAMGRTANLAARVESASPANAVGISADTLRSVEGLFITEDLGPHDLKGFIEPVSISRVHGVDSRLARHGELRANASPLLILRGVERET